MESITKRLDQAERKNIRDGEQSLGSNILKHHKEK